MKYNRQNLPQLLKDMKEGQSLPVYLIFGERFLCRQVAKSLIAALVPNEKEQRQAVVKIDGDNEDPEKTIASLRTFSLFGGRQIFQVNDTRLFLSKAVGKTVWQKAHEAFLADNREDAGKYLAQLAGLGGLEPDETFNDISSSGWRQAFGFPRPDDIKWTRSFDIGNLGDHGKSSVGADLLSAILEKGVPAQNHLLLLTDTVDKRKKLFKVIAKIGVVIDLDITGSATQVQKNQDGLVRDLLQKRFKEMAKAPGPRVLDLLVKRVGFHPVAAGHEVDKLCLLADGDVVTADLVEEVTSQTREDAIYELNDAFGGRNLGLCLYLARRLILAGLHPLVIIAALRNLLRKLLFLRALQEQDDPIYQARQSYPLFQKSYLPVVQQRMSDSEFLKGHPFVVYKGFQHAEGFTVKDLQGGLQKLLAAEFSLKGSGVREFLIIENFFFSMFIR